MTSHRLVIGTPDLVLDIAGEIDALAGCWLADA